MQPTTSSGAQSIDTWWRTAARRIALVIGVGAVLSLSFTLGGLRIGSRAATALRDLHIAPDPSPSPEILHYELAYCGNPPGKHTITCEVSTGRSAVLAFELEGTTSVPLPFRLPPGVELGVSARVAAQLTEQVSYAGGEALELPSPERGRVHDVTVRRRYWRLQGAGSLEERGTVRYFLVSAVTGCELMVQSVAVRACTDGGPHPDPVVVPTPMPTGAATPPPSSESTEYKIDPGTLIKVVLDKELSTAQQASGGSFTGRLAAISATSGTGSNAILGTASVAGIIMEISPEVGKEPAFMTLRLVRLSTRVGELLVETAPLRVGPKKKGGLLKRIIGGAAAGAIVGAIVDGKKGAAAGAAGGAAGTAIGGAEQAISGAQIQGQHLVLPSGTELSFKLTCCASRLIAQR